MYYTTELIFTDPNIDVDPDTDPESDANPDINIYNTYIESGINNTNNDICTNKTSTIEIANVFYYISIVYNIYTIVYT